MFKLSVTLLFIFACAPRGLAQGDHEYEGGGFAGSSFASDFHIPSVVSGSPQGTPTTVGVHYGSGYQLGARVGENLGDFWAADLEYSFANQPLRFTNLAPNIPNLPLGHSTHHFSYNVSYLPPVGSSHFRPYGKIGLGTTLYYIHGNSKDDALALGLKLHDNWNFTFNWGGGLKYVVDDRTVVVFDVKDFVSSLPTYGLPPSPHVVDGQYQTGPSASGPVHNVQLSIGIAFRWTEW